MTDRYPGEQARMNTVTDQLDWVDVIGTGDWHAEICGCGFSLGDVVENFPTRESAEQWLRHMADKTDYSPKSLTEGWRLCGCQPPARHVFARDPTAGPFLHPRQPDRECAPPCMIRNQVQRCSRTRMPEPGQPTG